MSIDYIMALCCVLTIVTTVTLPRNNQKSRKIAHEGDVWPAFLAVGQATGECVVGSCSSFDSAAGQHRENTFGNWREVGRTEEKEVLGGRIH